MKPKPRYTNKEQPSTSSPISPSSCQSPLFTSATLSSFDKSSPFDPRAAAEAPLPRQQPLKRRHTTIGLPLGIELSDDEEEPRPVKRNRVVSASNTDRLAVFRQTARRRIMDDVATNDLATNDFTTSDNEMSRDRPAPPSPRPDETSASRLSTTTTPRDRRAPSPPPQPRPVVTSTPRSFITPTTRTSRPSTTTTTTRATTPPVINLDEDDDDDDHHFVLAATSRSLGRARLVSDDEDDPARELRTRRQWIEVEPLPHPVDLSCPPPIGICTYNVLCEETRKQTDFLYNMNAPGQHWNERWPKILKDINELATDIFCLQEVQDDHYLTHFKPALESKNYTCHYKRRTNEKVDGCVLAYRSTRLKELEYEAVEYNQRCNGFDKDNVAQIIIFEDVGTDSIFCVANTHIIYNMRLGHQKLGQLMLLLAHVQRATVKYRKHPNFRGVFLCGDFNLEPDSPLYKFLRFGRLRPADFNRDKLARTVQSQRFEAYPLQVPASLGIDPSSCQFIANHRQRNDLVADEPQHLPYRFCSAYTHYTYFNEPEVSTYQQDGANAPDYIFYSGMQSGRNINELHIQLIRRFSLPSKPTLDETCGKMPNVQQGSDHLPLAAWFRFT